MSGNMKGGAAVVAGALVGNWAAERFVLRQPGGDTGWVEVSEGFGMDDLARALVILVGVVAAQMVLRRV